MGFTDQRVMLNVYKIFYCFNKIKGAMRGWASVIMIFLKSYVTNINLLIKFPLYTEKVGTCLETLYLSHSSITRKLGQEALPNIMILRCKKVNNIISRQN